MDYACLKTYYHFGNYICILEIEGEDGEKSKLKITYDDTGSPVSIKIL